MKSNFTWYLKFHASGPGWKIVGPSAQNFKYQVKLFMRIYVFFRLIHTSIPSQMFYKISILKNFAKFTGKHKCWSPFSIKLQAFKSPTLYERYATAAYLGNLQNSLEKFFYRTHLDDCFWFKFKIFIN